MGNHLLLILALLLGPSGESRPGLGNVEGTITDARTGKPIAGAYVIAGEYKYGTASNEAGKFVLNGIPQGDLFFMVVRRCYSPWILFHLKVEAGKTTELKVGLMDPSQLPSDSVRVQYYLRLFDPDSARHSR